MGKKTERNKSGLKYVSVCLILLMGFLGMPQVALAESSEYSQIVGGQYIAEKAFDPDQKNEETSSKTLTYQSGMYHSPLSPVEDNSENTQEEEGQVLNEFEQAQVKELISVIAQILETRTFAVVADNSQRSSSDDSRNGFKLFIDNFIEEDNNSSIPSVSEETQNIAQRAGSHEEEILTIVDIWNRIVNYLRSLINKSKYEKDVGALLHNREFSQGKGPLVSHSAIASPSNLLYVDSLIKNPQAGEDFMTDKTMVASVLIDEKLAAAHAFLNPPKWMHPYMRFLFYSRRVTPGMQQDYSEAKNKIKEIYKLAKEEGWSIRYGKKILRNYFLPMPDDMGGLYELVTSAMEA